MIDEGLILSIQRLKDSLVELKKDLRARYKKPNRQVTASDLKERVAKLSESWMVDLAPQIETAGQVSSDYKANLTIHFQRLLTFAEHATKRRRYDEETSAILKDFTMQLIIPLKQQRGSPAPEATHLSEPVFASTAFLSYSFEEADKKLADCVSRTLESFGILVVTGEKPKADKISEKVKRRIESQHLFVGLFTKRDKISHKNEWTTSAWLIDEKAYAVGKGRKLILFKEKGVGSIGGIQGDYEFIEFDRGSIHELLIKLLNTFELRTSGLKSS